MGRYKEVIAVAKYCFNKIAKQKFIENYFLAIYATQALVTATLRGKCATVDGLPATVG